MRSARKEKIRPVLLLHGKIGFQDPDPLERHRQFFKILCRKKAGIDGQEPVDDLFEALLFSCRVRKIMDIVKRDLPYEIQTRFQKIGVVLGGCERVRFVQRA